jgi:hypothetical protein
LDDVKKCMIVGTGVGVGLGRYPRWYVLVLSRGVDEAGNVVYKLIAQRDDGHVYVVLRVKEKFNVEDVVEMVDAIVKMIMKNDKIKVFELVGGSGALNIVYRRRAVWV